MITLQVTTSTSSAQSMHKSHSMAAPVLSSSYLSCRNQERLRAAWGWVVGWGSCCHRCGNTPTPTPSPYQIVLRQSPLPFLTFRRFRGGDPPAVSAFSCTCRTRRGMGEWWGCGTEGKGEGVEDHFGGCVGGWRRPILLTSPSFPNPPWLFHALLGLLFTLCHLFWALGWSLASSSCDFCRHYGTHKKGGGGHTHPIMPRLLPTSHHSSGVSPSRSLPSSESLFSPGVVVGAPR